MPVTIEITLQEAPGEAVWGGECMGVCLSPPVPLGGSGPPSREP